MIICLNDSSTSCTGAGCATVVDCTPDYTIGTCLGTGTVNYSDSSKTLTDTEYWNSCVFEDKGSYSIETHKTSTTGTSGSLTYSDSSLGGKYCQVYCIEELTTNFNKDTIVVQAGQYFVWDDQK